MMARTPAVQAPTASVRALIRGHAASLSPTERVVATHVLGDPDGVVRLGIVDLAAAAQVSTGSVLRFCHRIGFDGYRSFKLALAAEMGSRFAVLPQEIEASDSPMQIARKVFAADVQALTQSLSMLDEAAFEQALESIDAASHTEIFGVGSSLPIALDAYYRLLRIGVPIGIATDTHMQAVRASRLRPGDVAFVISHTGRTVETLAAASEARAAGATVIGLSSFFDTPLLELAHTHLVTATGESTFRVEAMASRIAHLSVVDALSVALAVRRFDDAVSILRGTTAIIEKRRRC